MDFRIQTAVLSGDNTKELRVFTIQDLSVVAEKKLTRRLCRLMDRNVEKWKRYGDATLFPTFCKIVFRMSGIYITNLQDIPAVKDLQQVLQRAGTTLAMVDVTTRYIDCYCTN